MDGTLRCIIIPIGVFLSCYYHNHVFKYNAKHQYIQEAQ